MNRRKIRNGRWIPEHKLKQHHLNLLKYVEERDSLYNLTQLSKKIGKSISTTSEHLKNLEFSGYIISHSDGINNYYTLTERGENVLRSISKTSEIIDRAHDIVFTFPIKRPPKKWFDETKFVVNKSMRNWVKQLTLKIDDKVVIQINGKSSISILVKEIHASSPELAVFQAYRIAENEIYNLILENPGLVVGNELNGYVCVANVSRQSHAIPNDYFAKYCFKGKIHIKGKETGNRFEVDASHGIPEIEFVNHAFSQEDYKRYMSFVKRVIDGRIDVDRLEFASNTIFNIIKVLAILISIIISSDESINPKSLNADFANKNESK